MASFPWSFHWFRLSLTVRPEWDFCKVDSSVVWYWWRPCLPTSMASFALWWYQLSGKSNEKCLENPLKSSSQFLLENCILPIWHQWRLTSFYNNFSASILFENQSKCPIWILLAMLNETFSVIFTHHVFTIHGPWLSVPLLSRCHRKILGTNFIVESRSQTKVPIPNLLSSHHRNQILGTKYFQT